MLWWGFDPSWLPDCNHLQQFARKAGDRTRLVGIEFESQLSVGSSRAVRLQPVGAQASYWNTIPQFTHVVNGCGQRSAVSGHIIPAGREQSAISRQQLAVSAGVPLVGMRHSGENTRKPDARDLSKRLHGCRPNQECLIPSCTAVSRPIPSPPACERSPMRPGPEAITKFRAGIGGFGDKNWHRNPLVP